MDPILPKVGASGEPGTVQVWCFDLDVPRGCAAIKGCDGVRNMFL
jgi:hypothetical protein